MIAGNQRTVARGNSCVAVESRVVLGVTILYQTEPSLPGHPTG
jgi:hypothetical protein